ncbi:MAG TPA: ATP-binding protein, partial [Reyranella sp.]|nr:ATP-binding protein [Reyranella sp.]
EFSTVELIEGVAETLAPQAAAKGLKLAAYVAAGVPERVTGDPLRLQQILFNLLGNAIKFTETGSVRLSLESAGGQALCIKVADTGIGLSREQQSRLFQPFVQADSSTTRRFGGTGLGLSIVRRLAEAMQGGIDVLSEPGEGATFMVTIRLGEASPAAPRAELALQGLRLGLALPDVDEARAIARYLEDAGARVVLAGAGFTGIRIDGLASDLQLSDGPATPDAAAAVGLPRPWRRDALIRAVARAAGRTPVVAAVPVARAVAPLNGRVLVVDDNSVNRKILARQLELAGASTDSAAGGEEALELWHKGGYDLVLADLQMPNMDGFELARRIRQSEAAERRARTPILAVTASALEEQEQKSRAAGMDGFITKPIGIEQLKATLDVWLKDAE